MRLRGKVAIVTGAGSGIGKQIARRFALEGASVVAADINGESAEETARLCQDEASSSLALQVDIASPGEVQAMVQAVLDTFGRIHVLVNNAALDQQVVPVSEMDVALWDRIFSVNTRGTFLCSRYTLPSMIAMGGGVIVNVASDLGYIVVPGLGAYCSSKGAVLQLTRVLAAENGPHNIRVNALCPTMIDTPMARRTIDSHPTPDIWVEEIRQGIPLRRLGTVEDVANAALFLASDESAYINGVCLPVDGGRTIL